jgi:hypothetical protein
MERCKFFNSGVFLVSSVSQKFRRRPNDTAVLFPVIPKLVDVIYKKRGGIGVSIGAAPRIRTVFQVHMFQEYPGKAPLKAAFSITVTPGGMTILARPLC